VKYWQITAKPGRFSKPFRPTETVGCHKMACCDCGLVHDMKFRAWAVVPGGYRALSKHQAVVMVQVRRNVKATYRRRKTKTVQSKLEKLK
jgi:hypothetical protein